MPALRAILPCLLLWIPFFANATCPTGSQDGPLTFDQVMLDFSDLLTTPDLAVQSGTSDPTSVSNSNLTKSIRNLSDAVDCANAVLNDTTGQLYPPEYYQQQGAAAQAQYLAILDGYMGELADALHAYESDFQQLVAESASNRDFTAAAADSQDVQDIATEAHQDLQSSKSNRRF